MSQQAEEPHDPQDPKGPAVRCGRCGAPRPAAAASGPCPACLLLAAAQTPSGLGASFEALSVERVAEALPAYEIQLLIGQGGMGAVYRARHRKLDRLVAIKVLRPLTGNHEAEAAAFTERFEREARVLAKLESPHIVRIYDYGRSSGEEPFFYLVLEFVEGASLRDLMRDGRLTAQEALALIPQVCEALHTAHGLGIVHRDIKPDNILVDGDGRVRVADFGLAKLKGAEGDGLPLTQTHQAFGTPHYMAPEQMRNSGGVDHRADLYSLGVVLYELLTGELPLGRFAAPSQKADAPPGLDDVVFKALASEPAERYQGADEIKSDLENGGDPPGDGQRESVRPRNRPADQDKAQRAGHTPPLCYATSRSWSRFVILLLLHFMTWSVVTADQLASRLGSGLTFPRGVQLEYEVDGFHVYVLGIPLWIGLACVFASLLIREFSTPGRGVEPRLVFSLPHVGSAL
ncbi:MAG: serine/threonine-protein kinase, partial [Planctomycetota bacterium]